MVYRAEPGYDDYDDRSRCSTMTAEAVHRTARRFGGALLAIVLAGCVSDQDYRDRMANACKVQDCVCVKRAALLITQKPTPVHWRANGAAFCPTGYSIQRQVERGDP